METPNIYNHVTWSARFLLKAFSDCQMLYSLLYLFKWSTVYIACLIDEYLMYVRGTGKYKGCLNVKGFFTKADAMFPFGRMGGYQILL